MTAAQEPVHQDAALEQVPVEENKPMTWEECMDENDFHDLVNDDSNLYNELDDIPMDDVDLVGKMIAIITNNVSEVWSPPRVTKLAHEYGLVPGFSYDIQTCDESGKP